MKIIFEEAAHIIDLPSFFAELFLTSDQYFWLFSLLISSQSVFAIRNSLSLKRYYSSLYNSIFKPLLFKVTHASV